MANNDTITATIFARRNGFRSGVDFVGFWEPKGFNVFKVKTQVGNDGNVTIGLPTFVLVKQGKARFASPDSINSIIGYFND
ncbi:hypothetical protein HMPREF1640_07140 [Prevotella sp. S7-1-8]|uniref:hypothetical protein n=1 Tax=Prevotella sp. S7-1-8 TaxID=1284775 RepID=UPI00050FE2C1|nr:hypothetical protein [Prevotella sp. S7-1-8]KGF17534.1 hypothetical protein HMPREF1640_07140 [Prevotella sp. S7-1-8]